MNVTLGSLPLFPYHSYHFIPLLASECPLWTRFIPPECLTVSTPLSCPVTTVLSCDHCPICDHRPLTTVLYSLSYSIMTVLSCDHCNLLRILSCTVTNVVSCPVSTPLSCPVTTVLSCDHCLILWLLICSVTLSKLLAGLRIFSAASRCLYGTLWALTTPPPVLYGYLAGSMVL